MSTLQEPPNQAMARVVERNIEALIAREQQTRHLLGWQDKLAGTITRFTGSMTFVFLHLAIFGAWIIINLGWTPLPPWDKSFVVLAMVASVEAIFLSTFVLISQNRMQEEADRRANLDVQISLLTEHEVTKLIALVDEIALRMGVERPQELHELKRDVAPEQVLDKIEERQQASGI